MKKYPKLVQCDKRGQIVIPKDIRQDLNIEEGTGFFVYSITNEGILLKKVETPKLEKDDKLIKELDEKSEKISLKKSSIKKTIINYKKTKKGGLELL